MKDAQDGTEQVTEVLPLFKTCYSRGKSILHLDKPKGGSGHSSLLNIIEKNNLKECILVEDYMGGFLDSKRKIESLDCRFIFGWRFRCHFDEKVFHKLIAFPLNKSGVHKLYKIYTHAFTKPSPKKDPDINGSLTQSEIKQMFDEDFSLCIPFYDSFIFENTMNFSNIDFDISILNNCSMFIENNGLPFDDLIKSKVDKYSKRFNLKTVKVKTIYYELEKDLKSFQSYKITCGRSSGGGKKINISRPELSHCGSDKFSFESWQKL